MAFLMSSARCESTPYGIPDKREKGLSSDSCPDSSLNTKKAKGEAEKARRVQVNTYQRTTITHRSIENMYEIHRTRRILFWSISRRSALSRSTGTTFSVELSMLPLSPRKSMQSIAANMSKTGTPSIDNEHDGMKRARGLTLLANER